MEPILDADDDLLPEYDFKNMRGGVRGKYYDRYRSRLRLVRIDAEVAAAFPTEEAVNRALKLLAQIAKDQVQTSSS